MKIPLFPAAFLMTDVLQWPIQTGQYLCHRSPSTKGNRNDILVQNQIFDKFKSHQNQKYQCFYQLWSSKPCKDLSASIISVKKCVESKSVLIGKSFVSVSAVAVRLIVIDGEIVVELWHYRNLVKLFDDFEINTDGFISVKNPSLIILWFCLIWSSEWNMWGMTLFDSFKSQKFFPWHTVNCFHHHSSHFSFIMRWIVERNLSYHF